MKRLLILSATALFATTAFAQEKGIHFEHGKSWKQIVAKATAEHKMIMLDCYTTWCGPCKMMTKNTFTDEKVGEFFNKNFINVKLQFDTTKNDNADVKKNYADAKYINSHYEITGYPTILFFDSNGNMVDKSIGYTDANTFLTKGEKVTKPENWLSPIVDAYRKNPKDQATIKKLMTRFDELDSKTTKALYDQYLQTEHANPTKEELTFIVYKTESLSGKGIPFLKKHQKELDAAMGKPGFFDFVMSDLIMNEKIMPQMEKKMDKLDQVDWVTIRKNLMIQYPEFADGVVRTAKLRAIYATQNMEKKMAMTDKFIADYEGKIDAKLFANAENEVAYLTAQSTNDPKLLNKALNWSKKSIETSGLDERTKAMYKDTYASILYKTGKKAEAVKLETEIRDWAEKAGDNELKNGFDEMLGKMKKGQDLFQ